MFRPKKSLSQHFLVNQGVADKIVNAAEISPKDTILEIGPGYGILTQRLLERTKKLIVVEIDGKLCQLLKEKFENYRNLKIIESDILKINLAEITQGEKIKIVANLPYKITTPILEYLFDWTKLIKTATLMVQYEVAKRMIAIAKNKEYGALSIFVQYHTQPKILFLVKPGSFFPRPKVNSAVVRLDFHRTSPFKPKDETLFFQLVRMAFQERRKMLRGILSRKFALSIEKLKNIELNTEIDLQRRGETLSINEFVRLANFLSQSLGGQNSFFPFSKGV